MTDTPETHQINDAFETQQADEETNEEKDAAASEEANQEAVDQWVFLVDPMWEPPSDSTNPPLAAVVGGWMVTGEGVVNRFEPNPDYEPATPHSPTDPVDAALRMVAKGEADSDALYAVIREAEFAVALDENQQPLVELAPDDVPSLLVTTAPAHRQRVHAEGWRPVSAPQLADLLAEREVDVLFNPGASVSIRLLASAMAEAMHQSTVVATAIEQPVAMATGIDTATDQPVDTVIVAPTIDLSTLSDRNPATE